MYPTMVLPLISDANLARTGFPLASLLVLATVLIVAGLLFVRGARLTRAVAEG